MSIDYGMIGTDEFEEAASAPIQKKTRINLMDYDRLKHDTGIEKFRFEVSSEDHAGYSFDFLPFPVSEKHPRYKALKHVSKDNTPVDWKLNLVMHRIKTPFGEQKVLCPEKNFGRPCPLCEKKRDLFNEGGSWEGNPYKDQIKALNDTERDYFLVLNRDDGKVYAMEYSSFYFGEKLKSKLGRANRGEKAIILAFPGKSGHSLRFWVEPSKLKGNNGKPIIGPIEEMEFEERPEAIDTAILESLPPLDSYIAEYSYDDILAMEDGTFFVEDDEDDDDTAKESTSTATPQVTPQVASSDTEPRSRRSRSTETPDPAPSKERPVRRGRVSSDGSANTPVPSEPPVSSPEPDVEVETKDQEREERRKRRMQRSTPDITVPKCPAGGTFGTDIDTFSECDDCQLYDACDKAYQFQKDINII